MGYLHILSNFLCVLGIFSTIANEFIFKTTEVGYYRLFGCFTNCSDYPNGFFVFLVFEYFVRDSCLLSIHQTSYLDLEEKMNPYNYISKKIILVF